MLQYFDCKEFLSQGEDIIREFKPNFKNNRERIGATLTAYANDLNWMGGGYLFIGVDNSGGAIGYPENFDDLQKFIADLCRNDLSPPLAPFFRQITVEGKSICEVKIVRSINRPHRFRQNCHIRIGSTTRVATFDEEQQIRQCSIIPS